MPRAKDLSIEVSNILSSMARFRVLDVLFRASTTVPLRTLERLSGLAIRSVQVAVLGLEKEKIISRKSGGFHIRDTHPQYDVLRRIFSILSDARIQERAKSYDRKAVRALQISHEVASLVRRGK